MYFIFQDHTDLNFNALNLIINENYQVNQYYFVEFI